MRFKIICYIFIALLSKYIIAQNFGARYYVDVEKLNVRESPSINSEIVGSLNYSDEVIVTVIVDGWANISIYDPDDKWVSFKYLVKDKPRFKNNKSMISESNEFNHITDSDYENLLGILSFTMLLIGFVMTASGPKRDKRFKTGYKNNQLPNKERENTGLGLMLIGGLLFFYSI